MPERDLTEDWFRPRVGNLLSRLLLCVSSQLAIVWHLEYTEAIRGDSGCNTDSFAARRLRRMARGGLAKVHFVGFLRSVCLHLLARGQFKRNKTHLE